AAYVNSLFRPEIIRDLDLKKHGFEMLPRSPSSFTPFPDKRYLMMGPDPALNRSEVSKFSVKDADALPRYEKMLEKVADFIEPTLTETPPNPFSRHHRRHGRPIDAGHSVCAVPSCHGRVQRRPRRLGLHARRHGRHHPVAGRR